MTRPYYLDVDEEQLLQEANNITLNDDYKELIVRIRKISKMLRRPKMNSFLQAKVKEWQKENGMRIQELKTKLDCKTRLAYYAVFLFCYVPWVTFLQKFSIVVYSFLLAPIAKISSISNLHHFFAGGIP